jgi:hypothetical protein
LAFDADALDNPNVARALADCQAALDAEGLGFELERWDKTDGKGIDDLLAAGKTAEVLTGEAARVAMREALAAATADAEPPPADELERLAQVLAEGGATALFADRPLLEALARLKEADAAAFAARRASLKGQVSLHGLDAALKPLQREQARQRPPALLAEAGYRIAQGRLCREHGTFDGGTALIPLCNFTAKIKEVVTRDDGVDQTSRFVVAGSLAEGRELPPVEVPAADLAGMAWVTPAWHGEAVVYAGQGTRDHLRAAIELLSPERTKRTVYAHTGWRQINGTWHYLHAGGAISKGGLAEGIEVSLPGTLADYILPAPPKGKDLIAALRASLTLLDGGLAPDRILFPLLGGVFRATLGTAPGAIDLSLYLSGPHGAGKSELAALCQQHFGPGLDGRHLPGSWLSTGNALEALAFTLKDALFVVDDYAPRGATADRQRLEREADRLLRAQGNRAGRQRMRADGTLRPERPPRGLILSTGEDVPNGQSLRGRLLILEVSRDDVPLASLTPHQQAASTGLYAKAMAGFVRWLASQYDALCERLAGEKASLRDRVMAGTGSPRTPGIVADLALGLKFFFDFARASGAITEAEQNCLYRRGWNALEQAAVAQAANVQAAEPTGQFIRLLSAAIVSGRAHVASPDGGQPESPAGWGWRSEDTQNGGICKCLGKRIGWLQGDDLYLEPEAAYAAAQELAHDQGEALPLGQRTLWKHLRERGVLVNWEGNRQRNTVRRTLEGKKDREVLYLRADSLASGLPSEPSASQPGSEKSPKDADINNGRFCGPSNGRAAQPSVETVRKNAHKCPDEHSYGRCGRPEMGEDGGLQEDSELL